jgi:HD-like signal output (HDOD) protein
MKDDPDIGYSPHIEVQDFKAEIPFDFYPTFSVASYRLNEICGSLNPKPQDIFAIINSDPLLTCRVYALYHEFFPDNTEEFFGLARIITELGINTVKNDIIKALEKRPPADKKTLSEHKTFLHRSLSAAVASLLLAKRRGIDESCLQKYYCSGLLYDIGSFILSEDGGAAAQVSEGDSLAKGLAPLSAWLAAKFWGFPPALRDAAVFNGQYKNYGGNYTGHYTDVVLHTALAVSFVNKGAVEAASKPGVPPLSNPHEAVMQDISIKLDLPQTIFEKIEGEFNVELKKILTFIGMEKA